MTSMMIRKFLVFSLYFMGFAIDIDLSIEIAIRMKIEDAIETLCR